MVSAQDPSAAVSSRRYLRLLEPFASASIAMEYVIPERPDLLCYGNGYGSWGVQTQQKAFSALSVLAADPDFDSIRARMSREAVLDRALRMLRFSLESHHTGSVTCTDGDTWGHTWISGLGIERMMHGVEAIENHLTESDCERLRTVLISEAANTLENRPVKGGTVENNVPESNAWNGALLLRTAELYPDAPRADDFREKGIHFLMNSISIAADAKCHDAMDGRPVSEWFVGDNFFGSYALNHHRYMNVGYMVITLSNIAMLHFFYRRLGRQAPQALYHHAADLWRLVKAFTFPDGRLVRIGGDTRVRYCYCQDYAIPVWLFAADHLGDTDVIPFEAGWLDLLASEMGANGDGTYLARRCAELSETSHGYYARLESDRAATISMGAYWRRLLQIASKAQRSEVDYSVPFAWHDDYHGSSYHRSSRRIASWTWRAAEPPQGLCVPADTSSLAEWRENLTAQVLGEGANHGQVVESSRDAAFEGGFLTWGRVRTVSTGVLEGQQDDDPLATQHIVFAALPEAATCLLLQHVRAPERRVFVCRIKGLGLLVPNDLFNDCQRTYYTASGEQIIQGAGSAEGLTETGSLWVNIDDRLGVSAVYGTDQIYILKPGRRQIGLRSGARLTPGHGGGMLYADEMCGPYRSGLHGEDPGATLVDAAFMLQAGVDHKATSINSKLCAATFTGADSSLRAVTAEGIDGNRYLLVANVGDESESAVLGLACGTSATDLVCGERIAITGGALALTVSAASARLFRIDG